MTGEAWAAIAAIVSSLSLAVSGVLVARVNTANKSATQARDLAEPTGNGYADESRRAWRDLKQQVQDGFTDIRREMREQFERAHKDHEDLAQRHVRTNTTVVDHLRDHVKHDLHIDGE